MIPAHARDLAVSRLPHRLVVSKVGPSAARAAPGVHVDAGAELVDGATSVVDVGASPSATTPIGLVALPIAVSVGKRRLGETHVEGVEGLVEIYFALGLDTAEEWSHSF